MEFGGGGRGKRGGKSLGDDGETFGGSFVFYLLFLFFSRPCGAGKEEEKRGGGGAKSKIGGKGSKETHDKPASATNTREALPNETMIIIRWQLSRARRLFFFDTLSSFPLSFFSPPYPSLFDESVRVGVPILHTIIIFILCNAQ
jgi:hypothetical protein